MLIRCTYADTGADGAGGAEVDVGADGSFRAASRTRRSSIGGHEVDAYKVSSLLGNVLVVVLAVVYSFGEFSCSSGAGLLWGLSISLTGHMVLLSKLFNL